MRTIPFPSLFARIAVLLLVLPAGLLAAQNPDSATISKLLQSVKTHAANADDDAATLSTFARSGLERRHHAERLNQIKEHVNDLIRDGNELSSMREEGSPWQRQAIDGIVEILPEMADHLTATINYLNEHPKHTRLKPFQDYVFANEKLTHNAHEIISNYVDYGEAKAKAEAMEKDLQISSTAAPGA